MHSKANWKNYKSDGRTQSLSPRAIARGIDSTDYEDTLFETPWSIASIQTQLSKETGRGAAPRSHLLEMATSVTLDIDGVEAARRNGTQVQSFRALLGTLVERIEFNPHADTITLHFI